MKNYGSPDGIPVEEAMQAYLNDHLGEHAPRVGTETGEPVGFLITEWTPDNDVWKNVDLLAESIGCEAVFTRVGEEAILSLRPCDPKISEAISEFFRGGDSA